MIMVAGFFNGIIYLYASFSVCYLLSPLGINLYIHPSPDFLILVAHVPQEHIQYKIYVEK